MKHLSCFLSACKVLAAILRLVKAPLTAAVWRVCALRPRLMDTPEMAKLNKGGSHV